MAYRKKPKASKGEAKPRSKESQAKKDLLERIRDRYRVMSEADDENRKWAKEDIRFVNEPGAQWDSNMKQERGDRPCYEFNKLRINGKRVINEIRANRPQGKVRAVENGDKEGAELREGLCRNIANMSDFESIVDYEAEYQVDGGLGAWRVTTDYADDSMFDQDIKIEAIKNPLCLYWDPAAKDLLLKRDAEDWILVDHISSKAYEAKYGDAEQFDFSGEDDSTDDWEDEETVRIVEYWYKEPYDKELWLVELPNPETGATDRITVDSTTDEAQALMDEGVQPVKTRTVHCHKIMMCVASGKSILEGPVEVAGTEFPFIVAHGEIKVVEGKVRWWGLHRFSKDAQRSYNVSRTAIDETIAMAPKAQTWATTTQAEGLLDSWAEAHRKNIPIRLYNSDPNAPGAPVQHPGAQVPVALLEQAEVSSQDIRDTSGLHEASFGEESKEKSGIALARKQNQAQIVTYNFPDNMAKAVKRTWEIVLDRIPHIYDAERELRIIGADGAEDYKRVNQVVFDQVQGKAIRVNDLSAGKYDVTVTVGPSFSTLRQEAAEVYPQLFPPESPMYPFVADLIAKSLDYPFADEFVKRLQMAAPPPVQAAISEGKELPPEVMQAQAQVQQAMQMVQQQAQLVQQAAMESEQKKADAEKAAANVQKLLADLEKHQAQFDAHVAKMELQFVQRGADLDMKSMQIDGAKQQLDGQAKEIDAKQQQTDETSDAVLKAQEAVAQIDAMAAQFMEAQAAAMAEMRQMMMDIKSKPRVKSVRLDRSNGQVRAVPEFDDEDPNGGGSPPLPLAA